MDENPTGRDPLTMDIAKDVERVDDVFTHILKDRSTWDEFKRDPNGAFVRLGLHPPTTPEINERVNRIFYAALTNRELIDFVLREFEAFSPEAAAMSEYHDYFMDGLRQGVLRSRTEFDLAAVEFIFQRPDMLRQMYQLLLYDLNDQRILEREHSREEIDAYIDALIAGIQERRAIRDLPKLEVWDRNYGIGNHYGTGCAEVGPAASAEVVVVATAAIPVEVLGLAEQNVLRDEMVRRAVVGDPEATRAFAIFARMLDLGADLILHAYTFERR